MNAVTEIPILYRDIANHKDFDEIALQGQITDTQIATLRASLQAGTRFVPTQIGMEHLGEVNRSEFPTEDDHSWHEVELDQIKVLDLLSGTYIGTEIANLETVDSFISRMQAAAAAGWKPVEL